MFPITYEQTFATKERRSILHGTVSTYRSFALSDAVNMLVLLCLNFQMNENRVNQYATPWVMVIDLL